MEKHGIIDEFSLSGGPLHRLGCRLGLVRGRAGTVPLGLALGWIPWLVVVALAFIEGVGQQIFSLSMIGGHVRLLLVIPLLFLCESIMDPRLPSFVRTIVDSGVVPPKELPALESEMARLGRWKDAWLAEAICLVAAVLLSLPGAQLHLSGSTASLDPSRVLSDLYFAGQWYWIVCLTLFRFLIFRWLWRLSLWCYFLWRVSRLELDLVPTHPDYAAGLGYLEVVHAHFTPLIFGLSALQSASFAEEISTGSMAFEAIYPAIAVILALDAVLFLAPLFIFSTKLWACRIKGLGDYMAFASGYVRGFDRKWLGSSPTSQEPLLGTADLQSLADLGNSIDVVRNMHWVPMSMRLVKVIVLAALLPLVPLLLLKYPAAELTAKFFARLTGL